MTLGENIPVENAPVEKTPGAQRRLRILELLEQAGATGEPVSGGALAETTGVSRQVVVQDIALLRSAGHDVIATNRGYLLERAEGPAAAGGGERPGRLIKVRHTPAQTADELNAIVDLGGCVENVMVNHRTYGQLEAPLDIKNRRDVRRFLDDLAAGVSSPLMTITDGYHFHRVTADTPEQLDEIEAALGDLGFLAPRTEFERTAF